MSSESDEKLKGLVEALDKKYKRLTEYRTDLHWKFYQGKIEGAHRADYDDSSWGSVSLPFAWDPAKGDVWLRCAVSVPEQIDGIEISGTKAEMYSFVMTNGTEIFVNSKLVLREEYWTDLRGPRILIAEKANAGERHVVAIHCFVKIPVAKGERAGIPPMNLSYEAVEKVAFEVGSLAEELGFAPILQHGKETALRVADEFRIEAISMKTADLLAEINRANDTLASLSSEAREFKIHLIGHAHIDMDWLWPWKDTLNVIERDFSTVLSLMDRYPDLHFSHSQGATYKVVEENFPELFERVRQRVSAGNWDITASMWVESDLNMVGTEALVRQFLHSKRYIKAKFGLEPRMCWEPDTFGHIWTMPQIAKKSGMIGYYLMRCAKAPLCWWEGPDGSRILAFNSVYNNEINPRNVVDVAKSFYERYRLKTSMFVYGVGDHGGGPMIEDIKAAHELQKKPAMPQIIFSTTHAFFDEVLGMEISVPVVRDELNFTFDGCYTSHADIKRYNRLCERLLVDAEKLSIMAGSYPRGPLSSSWEKALFNQFHDILDGSGIPDTYAYSSNLAEDVVSTARGIIGDSMNGIAEGIKFSRDSPSIVVFNSLPWDRKDVARIDVKGLPIPENPAVLDCEGMTSQVQIEGNVLTFIAEVPSLGYATYYLVQGREAMPNLGGGELALENEFLRVAMDGSSGGIASIYDKRASRFVTKLHDDEITKPFVSNLFQVFHEAPHGMSAWVIGNITHVDNLVSGADVKLTCSGPIMTKMRSVRKYGNSIIDQDIVLYKGVPRIDFHTIIDWEEVAGAEEDAPMLKVSFSPVLRNSAATFEIPFGSIVRPADGREVPALRWIDVSDHEYGVSLLNDCKYGFSVSGNTMSMTLLRTSYSPDPMPDRGHHELLYSLYPHAGDWRKALTFRRGYEINHPLEAKSLPRHRIGIGSRPERASFIRISPDNVVLSGLKLAEDSDDIILRIYDATGEGARAEIAFGFEVSEAKEVDLMEKELSKASLQEGILRVELRPNDIRSVRITKGPRPT